MKTVHELRDQRNMERKYVLRGVLKSCNAERSWMFWEMEFQSVEAEIQKALPPNNFSLCRRTNNRPESEDLSMQTGVYVGMKSEIYGGQDHGGPECDNKNLVLNM